MKNIKIGDSFLVEGGGNDYGSGTQIALVNKVTKQGNIYCYKFSMKSQSIVARNHKLKFESIIKTFPFMVWLNNDMSAVNADRLEETLGVKFSQLIKGK